VNRDQLEHVVRAAADIADDEELIILGSQAILGQFPDAPADLCASIDVDLYPKNHPERAELIDGTIGELSPFHETYGYYAHGVSEETAILPRNWRTRLIAVYGPGTRGATGWCLEVHDLAIAKAAAGREKDRVFLSALARHRLVRAAVLLERLAETELSPDRRELVERQLRLLRGT
jgi:hypothetical protein